MAGRFLLQKFSSGMSRSTSLLGPHASASARAGAPAARTASECSIKTLGNLFHGAAMNPSTKVPNNPGIHGYAARSFPCSHAAPQTCCPKTGMPSITINPVKRTFSSSASTHGISRELVPEWEARRAAWQAEEEVKSAAWRAERAAWRAQLKNDVDGFTKFMRNMGLLWGFNAFVWMLPGPKKEESTSG